MAPKRIAEALLTRTSTPPAMATASSTQRLAPSSVDRSTGAIASIRPPAARTRSTVSCDGPGLRSQPITCAPSRANISAVARPMPPPVPVTSATLPSRRPAHASPPAFASASASAPPPKFLSWSRVMRRIGYAASRICAS